MKLSVIGAVALAALAGCASTPTPRYFTLDMRPAGLEDVPASVTVERLRPVQELDRAGMLAHTSPIEITYDMRDQWASSVGEQVAHKLAVEFAAPGDGRPSVVLSGRILEFDLVPGGEGPTAHARIEATFRAATASRHGPPLMQGTYEARAPLEDAGPAALAQGLSRAIETIAAAMAADLREALAAVQRQESPQEAATASAPGQE